MSGKNDDDDFWYTSDVKSTNFFQEDEGLGLGGGLGTYRMGTSRLSQQLRDWEPDESSSITGKYTEPIIPLAQLMSDQTLTLILNEDISKRPDETISYSPQELVNKLIIGIKVNLNCCKSLQDKKNLLSIASKSGDGETILAVTLFTFSTLSRKHFYNLLRDNHIAFTHYVNYLSTKMDFKELSNVFEALSQFKSAAYLNYRISVTSVRAGDTRKQIQDLHLVCKSHFNNDKDERFIKHHLKLLEFQQENAVPADLSARQTIICCANKSIEILRNLSTNIGMSDRIFQWSALKAKASIQSWKEIHSIFQTKSWLGSQKFKPLIPMSKVALELCKAKAPKNEINYYLQMVDDVLERQQVESAIANLNIASN